MPSAATDTKDPFSLFGNEEEALRNAEQMSDQLLSVSDGVKALADAYRQGLREQRRMLRISDRMQLDLQRANQTLQLQKEELKELNVALEVEIEQRKKLMHELHILATVDSLTQVLSRRRVYELGNQAFDIARSAGSEFSVVLMDIDFFKKINDNYGHGFGDVVLRKFGEIAKRCYEDVNHVGRLGGEEFVVILPNCPTVKAQHLANIFRNTLEATVISCDGVDKTVTVSIGVASISPDDTTLDKLIQRSDEALYEAKHSGRNRVVCAK